MICLQLLGQVPSAWPRTGEGVPPGPAAGLRLPQLQGCHGRGAAPPALRHLHSTGAAPSRPGLPLPAPPLRRHPLLRQRQAQRQRCEIVSRTYGETADECAEAYYYYGKALLELRREAVRWQGGRITGWQEGRMAGWQDGRMAGWQDGRVAGWKDGRVVVWQDSRMAGWKDSRMAG